MRNGKIPFFHYVMERAKGTGSLYRGKPTDRSRLIAFLDANSWFGQAPGLDGQEIYMELTSLLEERVGLWLGAYGLADKDKITLLLEAFQGRYPDTCTAYRDYIRDNGGSSVRTDLRVLDYLLSVLDEEVIQYREEELQPLISGATGYLDITCRNRLLAFISSLDGRGLKLSYKYAAINKKTIRQDTDAYTIGDFSRMAYLIFSAESWQENSLLEKASENSHLADMWLFLAMHFVCALRAMDIFRLPAVRLPMEGHAMKASILAGAFTEKDAAGITRLWVQEIGAFRRPPGKTAGYGGIPELKISIPKTVESAFGMMLAVSASHHEGAFLVGNPYCLVTRSRLRRFFGEGLWPVGKTKGFQTRRANKSYLQGIEMAAEDGTPGRVKGYMLAALARSHKGGIGTLPGMTGLYLKDASFTGLKPEFILREMFERGIFGFVPVLLLEMADRKVFRSLTVNAQTRLVRSVGLEAWQIEKLASAVSTAKEKARAVIRSIFTDPGGVREELVMQVLQKVGADEAPAKHDFFLCARTAAGMTCPSPDRSSCIGCGAEIYTREAFQELMREYLHLCAIYREAGGWEALRLSRILEEGIMPAVALAVESIGRLYPDADVSQYLKIVEEGIARAGTGLGR